MEKAQQNRGSKEGSARNRPLRKSVDPILANSIRGLHGRYLVSWGVATNPDGSPTDLEWKANSNNEHLETAIEVPWVGALKATSGHKLC
jgi:hypothetical protein